MTDKKQELAVWLRTLACARDATAIAATVREEALRAVEASPSFRAWQDRKAELAQLQDHEDAVAETIRALALELYRETQDKHPSPAVVVKVGRATTVTDETAAKAWAIHHYILDVLKLDAKAISKLALAMPVDGVTVEETLTAAIDRDLSAFLEG